MSKRKVNDILRGSWTEAGVKRWWDRPRFQLDGKTPNEVWKEGDHKRVYDLALSGLN